MKRLWSLVMPDVGVGRGVYLFTLASELVAIGSGMLVLLLAGRAFGAEGFGEYAVARRLIALAGATLGLSTGVGLPRALALATGAGAIGDGNRRGLHLAAALLYIAPAIAVAIAAWAMIPDVRDLLLPIGSDALGWATVTASIGFAVHVIAHGYYRGTLQMWTAGTLSLVNLSAAPVVAMLLAGDDAARAVALTGAIWLSTSAAGVAVVARGGRGRWSTRGLGGAIGSMARFTLPRIPGDIALLSLFAVPTVMVARNEGPIAAGVLSFGLSAITLLSALLAGVGQVLLPRVAMLTQDGAWDEAGRLVRRVMWLWLATTAAGTLVLVAVMPQVLDFVVGESYRAEAQVARTIALAAIPYTVYLVLRNPLDAASTTPFNTINLTATLGMVVALLAAGDSAIATEWSLLISFGVLGVLSWGSWEWVLQRRRTVRP